MKGFRFILAALALCLLATSAFAQSNTGNLVGTVSDPSGAIPGATVTAKDNATNKERTVQASNDGAFTIPQLDVGTYTVTITAPGHKSFTAQQVKIDVNRDYTLNATLEAGAVTETVTVVAGADIV
ncbi:MAG TPA: carboxypeptidase-like regulatory domain-containing protein, partial [Pyrinomonadaceae bacterium]